MASQGLYNIADGLRLGQGDIYNFSEYVGGKNLTGGILNYTRNRGYFVDNISKNYDAGIDGRYGYGRPSIANWEAEEKIYGTDGVRLDKLTGRAVPAPLFQDMVGDYYRVNEGVNNSWRTFTTIDEFSLLGELLRNKNLSENVLEDTFRGRYAPYGADDKFITQNLASNRIGDDYVSTTTDTNFSILFGDRVPLYDTGFKYRDEHWTYTDAILDSQGLLTEDHEKKYTERSVETPTYQGHFTNYRLSTPVNDLFQSGKIARNKLEMFLKTNSLIADAIKSLPKYYKSVSVISQDDFYGEIYDKKDLAGEMALPSTYNIDGLYNFYGEKRSEFKNKNPYWYGKSYGVETNDEPEYYEVGDGKRARKSSVAKEFNAGSFRTNGSPNNATYTYYQEPDGGSPVLQGHGPNTPETFTPEIRGFSNTSQLMKKTNDLFRRGEISSLVNRFHTDRVGDDDFLISSYDKEVGMSRGRNLRRANNDRDKETGFDNPYCRVWTAHHQYSLLKNRIRPFMDGETFMSIKELQSNLGRLRPNNGAQRLNDFSTLQENGFVKITPYHDDNGQLLGGKDSLIKYMFSIENLAWKEYATEDRLAPEQIGPYGGRIMWFPPYNLKFTENVNTQWKDNDFIGRGEKIYTYVNTDRAGTLNFSLLIDHPSILNKSVGMGENGVTEEDILRFFAGCGKLEVMDIEQEPKPEEPVHNMEDNIEDTTPVMRPDSQYIEVNFIVFYPNNFSAKKYYSNMSEAEERLDEYEMEVSNEPFTEQDAAWSGQKLAEMNYDNWSLFGLNSGRWSEDVIKRIEMLLPIEDATEYMPYSELKKLNEYYSIKNNDSTTIFGHDTREYELDYIEVRGFASDHGYPDANQRLASDRANTMLMLAKHFCGALDIEKVRFGDCYEIPIKKAGMPENVNDLDAKIARSSIISFKLKLRDDLSTPMDLTDEYNGLHYRFDYEDDEIAAYSATLMPSYASASTRETVVNDEPKEYIMRNFHKDGNHSYYTYQNEYMYFKQLKATDEFAYKNIVKKVKFFDPAFHSMTPEGFNARLNFLHQCTRQGPTIGSHSGGDNHDQSRLNRMAGNLSFGRAPYCILRVGDFFYSKICIDSMSIDYDTGGGVQWDLNPEGAGVQPMMANVSLNFHFIGGQDIEGPVEQLQNALSYNYYANSSVYTPNTQSPMDRWAVSEKKDKSE